MASNNVKLIRRKRKLTTAEAKGYDRIRAEIAEEFPTGKRSLKQADPTTRMKLMDFFEIQHAIAALKEERRRPGLSLADVKNVSSIDRAMLCKLESGKLPNPTVATLTRYARAIGKSIEILLRDREGEPVTSADVT